MSTDTAPTSPATDDARLADLQARRWYAHKASLEAQLAEARELEARLPSETARLHEEWEEAKKALQAAKAACDVAETKFRALGDQLRAAKTTAARLREELQAIEATRPKS